MLFIKDGSVFNQIYRGRLSDEEMYRKISDTLTVLQAEKISRDVDGSGDREETVQNNDGSGDGEETAPNTNGTVDGYEAGGSVAYNKKAESSGNRTVETACQGKGEA